MLGWILVICLFGAGLLLVRFGLMKRGGVEEKEEPKRTQGTKRTETAGGESRDEKLTTYVCTECNRFHCDCHPKEEP